VFHHRLCNWLRLYEYTELGAWGGSSHLVNVLVELVVHESHDTYVISSRSCHPIGAIRLVTDTNRWIGRLLKTEGSRPGELRHYVGDLSFRRCVRDTGDTEEF